MVAQSLLLFCVGFMAGLINAVAGGGSFIGFPLLIAIGLTPITANATFSLVALVGTFSSAIGYKEHLQKLPKSYYLLAIPSFIGAIAGAVFLTKSSNNNFLIIAAFSMLMAVLLMVFQPAISKRIIKNSRNSKNSNQKKFLIVLVCLLFLAISIYAGYFGAGYGILALGLLGITGIKSIHQMNGLKAVLGIVVGASTIIYASNNLIDWRILPAITIGCVLGGYFGPRYASKLPESFTRITIITVGLIVTVVLFKNVFS